MQTPQRVLQKHHPNVWPDILIRKYGQNVKNNQNKWFRRSDGNVIYDRTENRFTIVIKILMSLCTITFRDITRGAIKTATSKC